MSDAAIAVMDEAIAKIEELREEVASAKREAADLRAAVADEQALSAELLGALQALVWAKDEAARYANGGQMAAMLLDGADIRRRGNAAFEAARELIVKLTQP